MWFKSFTLMMSCLRPRKGKRLAQCHTARLGQRQHWNPGLLPHRSVCFPLVRVNKIKGFASDDLSAVLVSEKIHVRKLKISRIY